MSGPRIARMLTARMRPESRVIAERLATRWQQAVATLPGFVSVSFFMDDDAGVYGYYSVWESREAAESVVHDIGEQLLDALAEHAIGEPLVLYYEVFEPPS